MWLLQSATKHTDYHPSSNAKDWQVRVLKWAKDVQDNPDDAWLSASVLNLLGVLANVEPDFLRSLESNGLNTSVLKDNVIARLNFEVNDRGNSYMSYWLYEALPSADRPAGMDIIRGADWTAKIDQELAAAQASIWDVDPVELAAATSLALSLLKNISLGKLVHQ
jgi:hypothetical protein